MAAAVEHVHLHKRIALNAMRFVGTSPRMLILSFILPTAFLSMWISNTATTAMMIPIMEAVIAELEVAHDADQETKMKNIRAMLAMAICMAANIGGVGTTIGTGPNLVLLGILDSKFEDHPLSFGLWIAFAFPLALICLVLLWLWLMFYYLPFKSRRGQDNLAQEKIKSMITQKCLDLGPISYQEKVVLIHFVVLVLLWLFRSPGFFNSYGDLLDVDDATPAIAVVILLFLMPSEAKLTKKVPPLIDWKTVEKRLPWGIILLLGGGFALAEASQCSCLNAWIGFKLSQAQFYLEFLT